MTNPPPVAPVVTDEMVQAVEAYLATLPASNTAELRAIIARQDKQLNEATDTFFAQKAELERLRAALKAVIDAHETGRFEPLQAAIEVAKSRTALQGDAP